MLAGARLSICCALASYESCHRVTHVRTDHVSCNPNYSLILTAICRFVFQVCNHPDLFEGRSIVSAFDMEPLQLSYPSAVLYGCVKDPEERLSLEAYGLLPQRLWGISTWEAQEAARLQARASRKSFCAIRYLALHLSIPMHVAVSF